MVITVLVAVLAVGVVVQAGEDYGAARAAACGGAEGIGEARALGSEGVEVRSFDDGISIASKGLESVVVAYEQDDIWSVIFGCKCEVRQ